MGLRNGFQLKSFSQWCRGGAAIVQVNTNKGFENEKYLGNIKNKDIDENTNIDINLTMSRRKSSL